MNLILKRTLWTSTSKTHSLNINITPSTVFLLFDINIIHWYYL